MPGMLYQPKDMYGTSTTSASGHLFDINDSNSESMNTMPHQIPVDASSVKAFCLWAIFRDEDNETGLSDGLEDSIHLTKSRIIKKVLKNRKPYRMELFDALSHWGVRNPWIVKDTRQIVHVSALRNSNMRLKEAAHFQADDIPVLPDDLNSSIWDQLPK
jgi:hypothetical protein